MRALLSPLRLAPVLFAALALAPSARAEGLVQLGFEGEIQTEGGAPIELELGIWDGSAVREFALNLHLARQTRAHDLASLLAARLRRAGAEVEFPGENAAGADPAQLFIENATQVNVRLGHGMTATVTLCDSAPRSLRVLPPETQKGAAKLSIAITSFHPHDRRLASSQVALDVDPLTTSARLSEALADSAIAKGWIADRPTPDRWSVSHTSDGSIITGCSVELRSPQADWRLELALEVPRHDGTNDDDR